MGFGVFRVQRIARDYAGSLKVLGLLGLDQDRQAVESAIVHHPAEGFEPKTSLADVLVSIDAARTRLLRRAKRSENNFEEARPLVRPTEGFELDV